MSATAHVVLERGARIVEGAAVALGEILGVRLLDPGALAVARRVEVRIIVIIRTPAGIGGIGVARVVEAGTGHAHETLRRLRPAVHGADLPGTAHARQRAGPATGVRE